MTYTSTVTSKGTITLPASIRKKLGITQGRKVTFSLHGDTISVKPESGWDEFFAATADFGAKARAQIATGKAKSLLTNSDIEKAAVAGRKANY